MVNAVSMSPLIAESQGIGSPVVGLVGRNGQVMNIDLFANNQGNYNAAVIGKSGSGKSFFINELVRNTLGANGRVWVIDSGRSYQKLCDFVGGQYIEFDRDSHLVINPFDTISDDFAEEVNMLKLLFSAMIAPTDGLSDYQKSALERAIIATWGKYKQDSTIDLLVDELGLDEHNELDSQCRYMASALSPYTTAGIHGRWFNGKSNLNMDNELVVLELEELKSKPDLMQVIMLMIMQKIVHKMYLTRDQLKIMTIDEGWMFLKGNGDAALFIEDGYRRARKYNGSFVTGTQRGRDFESSPSAMAALDNSDWVFILSGVEDSITVIDNKNRLTESAKQQIRSLRTEAGKYSEIFWRCGDVYGVGRLIADPYSALMSSTKAEDFEAVKNYQQQGLEIGLAIEQVLSDRQSIKNH